MPVADLTTQDREVIRRAMQVSFHFFDWDFQTRVGITSEAMRDLLDSWPNVDDTSDESDACLAINNVLNDLLHGVGITDQKAFELIGTNRAELLRVYRAWAEGRGWSSTGVR
jgi:hypothetical protein